MKWCVELIYTSVYSVGAPALTCPVQQSSSSWPTAGLCSAGLMSRGSSWRSSLICCQTAGSLLAALITSSALYYSSLPSRAFFFFFFPPHPLALSLFFNLIMESSAPPEQAAMPAAGEGIIFDEHVSVSRYRSTCGVNLAWRSGAILLCAREYEMLLSEAEVVKCGIWGETLAVSWGDFWDTTQLTLSLWS